MRDETNWSDPNESGDPVKQLKPWQRYLLLLVHWAIIINFLVEIFYASYMIFDVFGVPGGGTLGADAVNFPHEKMVTRRLYAIECWLAVGGLAVYLAITEIGPRLARLRVVERESAPENES
jgi:TRAP-type C4-dicarboxylate transport system permease small subunit